MHNVKRKTYTRLFRFVSMLLTLVVIGVYLNIHYQRYLTLSCLRSAHEIGGSALNYIQGAKCLFDTTPAPVTGFGWRVVSRAYVEASPIPNEEVTRQLPASIYNLADRQNRSTTIFAVEGEKTAFSEENRCRVAELPRTTLLFLSGRASDEPWYRARNVSLNQLMCNKAAGDLLGEACMGVTVAVFIDGDAWAMKSSVPCDLLGACANVEDPGVSAEAWNSLKKYRIK